MQEPASEIPPLWISDRDDHGNLVSPEVIDAAHRIWRRVLQYVQYEGKDLAQTAEILEVTCHCVSRALRRGRGTNPIRNLDAYLYWAFVRRFSRRMAHEGKIQYVDSMEAFADGRLEPDTSWTSMLENEIQFKQFLSYLEPRARIMMLRRHRGDSWAEVGQALGISAHNAEVQFAKAVQKARSRLIGRASSKTGRWNR